MKIDLRNHSISSIPMIGGGILWAWYALFYDKFTPNFMLITGAGWIIFQLALCVWFWNAREKQRKEFEDLIN